MNPRSFTWWSMYHLLYTFFTTLLSLSRNAIFHWRKISWNYCPSALILFTSLLSSSLSMLPDSKSASVQIQCWPHFTGGFLKQNTMILLFSFLIKDPMSKSVNKQMRTIRPWPCQSEIHEVMSFFSDSGIDPSSWTLAILISPWWRSILSVEGYELNASQNSSISGSLDFLCKTSRRICFVDPCFLVTILALGCCSLDDFGPIAARKRINFIATIACKKHMSPSLYF